MLNELSRTELLVGSQGVEKLKNASVAVFGVGGVGSFTVEALARSGVGHITICDNDVVSVTNINRQLPALHSTLGRKKTQVMRERIADVNPDIEVTLYELFYNGDTADMFDYGEYTYIVDAIDTVSSKLLLIERANKAGVPIISCMGTGNKLDPTKLEISDIAKTSVCPLARVMRRELKKRGISRLKVLYSKEQPLSPSEADSELYARTMGENTSRRQTPGSVAFVPSVAGLIIAGEVVKSICGIADR